jgi:hypothetical protein
LGSAQAPPYTVQKFDEVVRHLHPVTQDQFSLVLKKDSGIPADNFNINIEVFRQTFTNVELLCYKHIPTVELIQIFYKCRTSSTKVDCLKTDATGARTFTLRFKIYNYTTAPQMPCE